ncbi:hypothetical protein Pan216_10280 [Planctomycetes bacterium Pan216]|uniref:Uncharacterized protein n=1 Tax=Kolteria novifilia TaxID=2527975 RepID=A0A518AZP8_9BACT|nr:hypothetical protein Pan216_10280 [Planctomycetes bacterium Pan216]
MSTAQTVRDSQGMIVLHHTGDIRDAVRETYRRIAKSDAVPDYVAEWTFDNLELFAQDVGYAMGVSSLGDDVTVVLTRTN